MAIRKVGRTTGTDNVRYIRVSSGSQVDTDYDPEGISLPAQRKAIVLRERELESINVAEFIEAGKSAKSMDSRPAFLEMIAYLKAHRNVKYVMVYALSRWARNRYDDAFLMMQLESLGVTLISATERNLDNTPAGKAMHGMISVFNQYTIDVMSEDIAYKMGQKVIAHGGTISQAPVGYKNVRAEFEGRYINTVVVDMDRVGYIRDTFNLYATGEYVEATLHQELVARGFTTPRTLKHAERPISRGTIAKMLRDRYYLGEVSYKGKWYQGRHQPIITLELFDRVQRVLDSHSGAGVRTRHWTHYLRGIFWCKSCGARLTFERQKGAIGDFDYYRCKLASTVVVYEGRTSETTAAIESSFGVITQPKEKDNDGQFQYDGGRRGA